MKLIQLHSRSGFTLIEVLIASALIGIGGTAMSTVYMNYFKSGSSYRVTLAMMEIESVIVSDLQDESKIEPVAASLAQGLVPTNFVIRSNNNQIIAELKKEIFVTDHLKACPNGFDEKKCFIKTEFDILCKSDAETALPSCKAAYRITVDSRAKGVPQLNPITTVADLTVQSANFKPDVDYTLTISYHNFLRKKVSNCELSGDSQAVVTGMNRETGEVFCATLPTTPALPNEIPVGLKFNRGAETGGAFSMDVQASRTLKCPDNYSLNIFESKQIDARVPAGARCIFIGQDLVPWQDPASKSGRNKIGDVFCTEHYRTKNTICKQSVASVTHGNCFVQKTCQTNSTCYEKGKSYPCVSYYDCSYDKTLYANQAIAADGKVVESDDAATCEEIKPIQPTCSEGVMTAAPAVDIDLFMKGDCELVPAQTTPAT